MCFALFAWFARAALLALSWNHQDCNRQSMQRVQNNARNQLGTVGGVESF